MESKGLKVFNKCEITTFRISIILMLWVIAGTLNSDVKNTLLLQLFTLFSGFKFLCVYYGFRIYFFEGYSLNKIKILLRLTYVFSVLSLGIYLVNMIFDILPNYGERMGLNTVDYFFGHPAEYNVVLISMLALNLYINYRFKNYKIDYKYLTLTSFLLFTTGRASALGYFTSVIICILILRYLRKYFMILTVFPIAFGLIMSIERISLTFFGSLTARSALLSTSFRIAWDYFPFGSGLGTFGSYASRVNYSPIYYMYNIFNIHGLSYANPMYINDSYWAMIIGEYGFIGAILMFGILFLLTVNFYRVKTGLIGFIIVIPFLYLMTTSLIDTTLVSYSFLAPILTSTLLYSIEKNLNKRSILNEDFN